MTLIGVAVAGVLLWVASQFGAEGNSDYWWQMGLLAAAGLAMAVSQLLGGWTKWGWPRLSALVFLLGFVPALVAGGLVLLDAQPDGGWGSGFAGDLGLNGLAEDLSGVLPAIAFLIGLTFGLTFDTTGPLVDDDVDVVEDEHRRAYPVDRTARDEPVTAERHEPAYPVDRTATDEPVTAERHALRRDERDERFVEDRDERFVEDRDGTVDRDRDRDGVVDERDGDLAYAGDDRTPTRRRGLFRR